MAKRKRRRRSSAPRARARHHRRRYRRNPGGFSVKAIGNDVVRSGLNAAQILVGKAGSRLVRNKLGFEQGSIVGSAIEIGVGLVGGIGLRRVSRNFAEQFMTGAFVSVEEAFLKQANIPFLSPMLGDEDESGLAGTYDLGDVDLDELARFDATRELGGGLGGTYDLGGSYEQLGAGAEA